MKVTVIPIVFGAFSRVTKGFENLEIRGQVETIETTALLRSARILRRVLETCYHTNSSEKPSAKTLSVRVLLLLLFLLLLLKRKMNVYIFPSFYFKKN